MNEKCSVCGLRDRATLEAQLLSGASIRTIARQYHLGRDTIAHHKSNHMKVAVPVALAPPAPVTSHQATPISEPVRTVPNEDTVCRYCFKTGAGYEWFINYRHVWAHGCGREWDGPTP
jgi:hypothetical protein